MRAKVAFVFKVHLVGMPGVMRTIAIRGDQTLIDLHETLRGAFDWHEDHLFAFWLSGKFWGNRASEYEHPAALEFSPLSDYTPGPKPKSADVRIDKLKLKLRQPIAYIFDFGDEWRVKLTLIEVIPAAEEGYPAIRESQGDAPRQYPNLEVDAA